MSWQGEIVTMVRHLISDVDPTNYTYSQDRLETAALVAAQIVQLEVNFEQTYTIDVEQCYLSPDPTDPTTSITLANRDDIFINLVALKTACLIMSSELRTYGLSSISVTDGPSSINYTAVAGHIKTLLDYAKQAYEDYKFNYKAGNACNGKAILSPYAPGADSIRHNFRSY